VIETFILSDEILITGIHISIGKIFMDPNLSPLTGKDELKIPPKAWGEGGNSAKCG
jgi:hypothetical protein